MNHSAGDGEAAVDGQCLAGDPASLRAAEEEHGARDIGG